MRHGFEKPARSRVSRNESIAEDETASPPGFDGDRARFTGTAARPRTAASDETAIFLPIFDQSRIAVIDLKAGRRRRSFQAKGWIYGEPTVTEDKVFFGSRLAR